MYLGTYTKIHLSRGLTSLFTSIDRSTPHGAASGEPVKYGTCSYPSTYGQVLKACKNRSPKTREVTV